MENLMPYIWVATLIVAIFAEAHTTALVAIWFIPSAGIAMILSFCRVPIFLQILVFLVLSVLFIVFSRTIFKKMRLVKHVPTNADALIGEKAVVTESIDNLSGTGQVKIRGQIWTARASDEKMKYDKGEILNVVGIEGVKLICKKIN